MMIFNFPQGAIYSSVRIRHYGGFTYIGLMIFLVILGATAAATLQVGSLIQRRVAEHELLAIGMEFRQALISYANSTPVGQSPLPATFEDLLKDNRFPNSKRHLRRIYIDPITTSRDWGIVLSPAGQGIVGVYSLSNKSPIKIENFSSPFESFNKKKHYRDWVFSGVVELPAPSS